MAVTRTIGPLHFEDLEPKRFEDLVRQLAYDFKLWRRLEPTGRAGSDDGFDARGFEIVSQELTEPSEDVDDIVDRTANDRLWLIQCKREKTITPRALMRYLSDTKLNSDERLDGFLFVAACDFSKRSRDVFRATCESFGIQEWHLWGKADLEDLLFRPEYDHLLFAYFGVSIAIRRRTVRSQVRARLTVKRKAKRVLDDHIDTGVLLRSADDAHYPYSDEAPDFDRRPPWMVLKYRGITHCGLLFVVRRHFAYIDDEGMYWDATLVQNDIEDHKFENRWAKEIDHALRQQLYEAWSAIDKKNQAWLEVMGLVPFERVVDIDEHGDDVVEVPHLYVEYAHDSQPFTDFIAEVSITNGWASNVIRPDDIDDRRIVFFNHDWRQKP